MESKKLRRGSSGANEGSGGVFCLVSTVLLSLLVAVAMLYSIKMFGAGIELALNGAVALLMAICMSNGCNCCLKQEVGLAEEWSRASGMAVATDAGKKKRSPRENNKRGRRSGGWDPDATDDDLVDVDAAEEASIQDDPLIFHPVGGPQYDYPNEATAGARVVYLEENDDTPPVRVRFPSGFTYWVWREHLIGGDGMAWRGLGRPQLLSSDDATRASGIQPRLHYLDNLRTFLTLVVLLHNVGCAFTGDSWYYAIGGYVNEYQGVMFVLATLVQAVVWPLFFFVSGYSVWRSLQLKGSRDFVQERASRLGTAYIAYSFLLGPALVCYAQYLQGPCVGASTYLSEESVVVYPAGWNWVLDGIRRRLRSLSQADEPPSEHQAWMSMGLPSPWSESPQFSDWEGWTCNEKYRYLPAPGHMWYAGWLFLLTFGFARWYDSRGANAFIPWAVPPGLCSSALLGALVGIAQRFVVRMNVGALAGMPLTFGSLTFNVVFFFAGVAAKQNKWLSAALPDFSSSRRHSAQLVAAVSGVVLCGAAFGVSYHGINSVPGAVAFVAAGVWCFTFAEVMLDLFSRACNFESKRSRFFAQIAYGVYFIHPLVVVPVTHSYVMLLRSNGEVITFDRPWGGSDSFLSSPLLLLAGFVYTSILSIAICCVVASCLSL